MEHLLGSFVPPPLLLVLVSTLRLLLLTQKETVKGCLRLHISETGCTKESLIKSNNVCNISLCGSLAHLLIRVVIILLLVLIGKQIQLYQLADVRGFLWRKIHSGLFQLLGHIRGSGSLQLLWLLLLVQSTQLKEEVYRHRV